MQHKIQVTLVGHGLAHREKAIGKIRTGNDGKTGAIDEIRGGGKGASAPLETAFTHLKLVVIPTPGSQPVGINLDAVIRIRIAWSYTR